jgi:hypothetical protein
MTIATAEMIWTAVAGYLAVGAVFALVFAFAGAARIDRATGGAGPLFRLLIVPGAALLWPLLAVMWLTGSGANNRDKS